jgi:small subunit ribosomal protein S6
MLLFQPDLEDDQLQAAVERVTRAIVNAGGSLSKISPWGKRRLAYPIQHHRDASYFLIHFDIDPSAVRDIERGLLISEEILRHLVVVLAPRQRRAVDETANDAAAGGDEILAPPSDTDEEEDVGPRLVAEGSEDDTLSSAEDEADDADSDGNEDDEHTADLKAAEEVVG